MVMGNSFNKGAMGQSAGDVVDSGTALKPGVRPLDFTNPGLAIRPCVPVILFPAACVPEFVMDPLGRTK